MNGLNSHRRKYEATLSEFYTQIDVIDTLKRCALCVEYPQPSL